MAFHDALFDDAVSIAGITARRADTGSTFAPRLGGSQASSSPNSAFWISSSSRSLDLLVDARMQKYRATPDLRRVAQLTSGSVRAFAGGVNCDLAIETRPGKAGRILTARRDRRRRRSAAPTRQRGEARFVRAESPAAGIRRSNRRAGI